MNATENQPAGSRVFFRGLNELRAIAALAVVLHHLELFLHREGRSTFLFGTALTPFIEQLGKNAVHLFFVLSGFLITYLLLVEHDRTGTIRIGKFYMRRVLRIWPLYYLIVLVAFVVMPWLVYGLGLNPGPVYADRLAATMRDPWSVLALFLFFMPNVALAVFPPVVPASQAWSVGVEEQFYAVWPVLVNACRRHLLLAFVAIAVVKTGANLVAPDFLPPGVGWQIAVRCFVDLKFEYMALGAIMAWMLRYRPALVERICRAPGIFASVTVATLSVLLVRPTAFDLLAILFACLIIVTAQTIKRGLPVLDSLGRVSYGIYMWHPLWLALGFDFVFGRVGLQGYSATIAFWAVVLSGAIATSYASYALLEQRLLLMREHLQVVASGRLTEKNVEPRSTSLAGSSPGH